MICHQKYTLDPLEETGILGAKLADTSIEENHGISVENGELLHEIISH